MLLYPVGKTEWLDRVITRNVLKYYVHRKMNLPIFYNFMLVLFGVAVDKASEIHSIPLSACYSSLTATSHMYNNNDNNNLLLYDRSI